MHHLSHQICDQSKVLFWSFLCGLCSVSIGCGLLKHGVMHGLVIQIHLLSLAVQSIVFFRFPKQYLNDVVFLYPLALLMPFAVNTLIQRFFRPILVSLFFRAHDWISYTLG